MAQFTAAELEVMQILWQHGEMKPAEIQKRFPRKIKNPALRSVLSILFEKGHVTRHLQGKAYFYKVTTKQRHAFRRMLRELVDTFCSGSTEALLLNLIKSEELSEDDLLELKRLADEGASRGEKSRRKSR